MGVLILILEDVGRADGLGRKLSDLVLAKLEGDLSEIPLDLQDWERKESEELLTGLTNAINTDSVFGEATSCENVSLVGNEACNMDDLSWLHL